MDSRHSPGYKAWTNKDQNGKLSKVQPSREEGSTLNQASELWPICRVAHLWTAPPGQLRAGQYCEGEN